MLDDKALKDDCVALSFPVPSASTIPLCLGEILLLSFGSEAKQDDHAYICAFT